MGHYRIVAAKRVLGGFEVSIKGPGIPNSGVDYWFACENEAQVFIENLNVSYSEAKQFAKWRKSLLQKRMTHAPASLHAASVS